MWRHDTCALFGALCGVGFLCAGVRRSQTFAFVDVTGDEVFDFLQDVLSVDSLAQRRYTRVALGGDAFALEGLAACRVTRIAHLFPVFSGRASAEKAGVLVSLFSLSTVCTSPNAAGSTLASQALSPLPVS